MLQVSDASDQHGEREGHRAADAVVQPYRVWLEVGGGPFACRDERAGEPFRLRAEEALPPGFPSAAAPSSTLDAIDVIAKLSAWARKLGSREVTNSPMPARPTVASRVIASSVSSRWWRAARSAPLEPPGRSNRVAASSRTVAAATLTVWAAPVIGAEGEGLVEDVADPAELLDQAYPRPRGRGQAGGPVGVARNARRSASSASSEGATSIPRPLRVIAPEPVPAIGRADAFVSRARRRPANGDSLAGQSGPRHSFPDNPSDRQAMITVNVACGLRCVARSAAMLSPAGQASDRLG